jgi:hypothetical protein
MQNTVIEIITPARAHELLKNNTKNRTLRRSAVTEFARQMKSGHWQLTHQGIAVEPDGTLLDGQHRLHAVVEAGVPVKMSVTYDVDPDSFPVVDCGIARSVADRLPLLTDKESNRIVVGIVSHYLKCTTGSGNNRCGADQVDDEFLDKTQAYISVTEMFRGYGKRCGLTKASIGAALAVYLHLDPAKGTAFCARFLSGEGLSTGQPAYTLREAALQGRLTREHDQYWKTTAACIADSEGRPLLMLQAATRDLYGNVYKRLLGERRVTAMKATETRRSRGKVKEAGGKK